MAVPLPMPLPLEKIKGLTPLDGLLESIQHAYVKATAGESHYQYLENAYAVISCDKKYNILLPLQLNAVSAKTH